MKKLLWIGSYVSGDALIEARRRGYGNPASVQSQLNILEGLEKAYNEAFDTIGALVLPPYPKVKIKVFTEIDFSHEDSSYDCLVRFNNYQYINKLSINRNLSEKVRDWAYSHRSDNVEVFIYEMRSACLNAAYILKRIIPSAKITLIIPDLPEYMDLRMGKVKRMLKALDWKSIKSKLGIVDNYILYAEPMVDYLCIRNKKWMVMEGSININDIKELPETKDEDEVFSVMYSGHVEERFGIKELADAFRYLPANYELWITGKGNAANYLEELGKKDNRIKYFGFLPNRQDLLILQSKADVFVNMRNPEEKASTYCFPSKLLEFMLTGKPVLTCKLGGIPSEYYEYLQILDGFSSQQIASSILRVSSLDKDKRKDIGDKSRKFIISKKNNIEQAKRIKRFVNGLNEKR